MLTVNDTAQIIIATCVLANALQSFRISWHNKKIVEKIDNVQTKVVAKIDTVKTEVVAVAKATNGLQEKLLAVTGELKFAEGMAEGVKSVVEKVKSSTEDTAAITQISR